MATMLSYKLAARLRRVFLPAAIAALLFVPSLLIGTPLAAAQVQDKEYRRAVEAYRQEELETAYIHLKNSLQDNPNHVEARLLLARVYFDRGEIRNAEKESEQALLLGADVNRVLPVYGTALVLQRKLEQLFELEQVAGEFDEASQLEWTLLKGQGYLLLDEPQQARREFESAADRFPKAPRAQHALAAYYLQQGLYEEAAAAVESGRDLAPDDPKTLQLQGDLALVEGRHAAALDFYTRAYRIAPQDLRILRGMALAHAVMGDAGKMQHYLELMLAQSPDDPAATLLNAVTKIREGNREVGEEMLADLADMLSRYEKVQPYEDDGMLFLRAASEYFRGSDENAINLLRLYLSRNEGDLAALRILADLYIRNDQTRAATDLLARNRELIGQGAYRSREGWNLAAIRVLSELYVHNGQTDAAITLLENNSELTASSLELSLLLAQLYVNQKNVYRARETIAGLNERAGDEPRVILIHARFLRSTGQSGEALALLNRSGVDSREPVAAGLLRGAAQMDLALYRDAEETARRLREKFPDNLDAINFHTNVLLRTDRLDAAGESNAAALRLAPGDTQALFHRAILLRKDGDYAQAKAKLQRLLERDPAHIPSMLMLAWLLMVEGDYPRALHWAGRARQADPASNRPEELELEIYTRSGERDKALGTALELTRADPLNETYLLQLADLYYRDGNYELMQRPLRRLFSLAGTDLDKLLQIAALQVRSGNLEEASLTLQSALEHHPKSPRAISELARLDIALGRHDAAHQRISALEQQHGQSREVLVLRGELALARGEPDAAQSLLMRAYRMDPSDLQTTARLFELAVSGVGGDAFIAALEATLREDTLPAAAVRMLADACVSQGRERDAIRYYENLLAIEQLPDRVGILNNLANLYAGENLAKGLETARLALDAGGEGSYAVQDTAGWILARQEKYEQALPHLQVAVELNPAAPELRFHLGAVLFHLDRKAEARTELARALNSSVDFSGREEAVRMAAALGGDR